MGQNYHLFPHTSQPWECWAESCLEGDDLPYHWAFTPSKLLFYCVPTSPFFPVKSGLRKSLCWKTLHLPAKVLPIPKCSRGVMWLPEFLRGRRQQVPFKQFSQECLEAESVLLAAQQERNTSNPSKKLNFSLSQNNLENVGQESCVLCFFCSLNPTACYSQYFCYSSC